MAFYGNRKTIKDWLNDNRRVRGCAERQVEYLRELNQINKELARIGTLTFFMLTRLGIENCRTMMRSANKQRNLIRSVLKDIKQYRVEAEWAAVFEHDIAGMRRRCDHVYKICMENLRLTEHWPYFNEVGCDRLLDFSPQFYKDKNITLLDYIIPEMEAWERVHKTEIDEYMLSVKDEIDAYNSHKAAMKEKEKEEKKQKKLAKAAAVAEIKEINENKRKEEIRRKKIEKEFETTMRHIGGWKK